MGTPEAGDLIEGTGGLRKIRVAAKGHGTRGGARVIYYHFVSASQLAMLYIYPKNEEQELSSAKRSALRTIIENWKRS
ncbi:type II toxin-antitoxin system RelE/ParE family toxin [Pseudomonas putida]|uniref:type II toxin-antitoxin system RelE/ParE family toxin n=1 Tax=Pseudomonas putida TaxID=303 RepID=UPI00209BD87E|nr:type II toxin-antitoxin system RelE/ParE family toxin [Pseudomonas putida]MEB3899196.1 type II toxin-antitoxin system RelE/ParE family toxin [Pseudomonas putida]